MKKLVILILAIFILSSCGTQTPKIEESESSASYVGDVPIFASEEELFEYVQNRDESAVDSEWAEFFAGITHYYKLKNPPPGATVSYIDPAATIVVVYDTHVFDVSGHSEHLMIKYLPYGSHGIETSSNWIQRQFPEESHIIEKDGLKYYIQKGTGLGGLMMLWRAEWVNEDGYNMVANFPFRFTAEEVLGYISDLERVDIR
jgi:hypothetical protein